MQIIADNEANSTTLLAVHSGSRRLYVTRGAGFDFDKAKHVFVPADQINFAVMPRRPEISCNHDITAPSQIEVGFFFAATPGALMGVRVLGRIFAGGNSIEQAKDGLCYPAGEHEIRLEAWARGRCDAYHGKEDLKGFFPLRNSVESIKLANLDPSGARSYADGTYTDGGAFRVIVPAAQEQMGEALRQNQVEVWHADKPDQSLAGWLMNLAPLALLAALWSFLIRQMKSRANARADAFAANSGAP